LHLEWINYKNKKGWSSTLFYFCNLSTLDAIKETILTKVSEINVPDQIEGYKVSCIGDDGTYKLPSTICSIVIANEIENIGNN
jgi:hypothetical protein